MEHLQRVWLASRERLPFRTPGSVPNFGTCFIFRNGLRVHRFIPYQNYMMFLLVLYPHPLFEAQYCLFCSRRRVAVARYRMICLVLANAPIVETKFLELAMSLLDFSPRIPLGTFSILLVLYNKSHIHYCDAGLDTEMIRHCTRLSE